MLKSALVRLQRTLDSRTAMLDAPWNPLTPNPALWVRFLRLPSPYRIQRSPPRATDSAEPWWLPKVEPIEVKSPGTGTWVTKRTGLGSGTALCARPARGPRRKSAPNTIETPTNAMRGVREGIRATSARQMPVIVRKHGQHFATSCTHPALYA